MLRATIILVSLLVLPMTATASDDDVTTVTSRANYWKFLREQKAGNLHREQPAKLEQALDALKDKRILERFQAGLFGFRPKLGGLETGSGFAFGTEFRPDISSDGQFEMRLAAQASLKGYQQYLVGLSAPRMANGRLFLDFTALQKNSPQEDFFGIGKDSSETNRSNFRYESTNLGLTFGSRPAKWLHTGAVFGVLNVNTGTGTDKRFPSVEQIFDEASVPGLDQQPDYTYAGLFVRFDNRDEPGNPRSGGKYSIDWKQFNDRGINGYAFNRVDAELQQYFPFFNKRRVIAFRGRTAFSQTGGENVVPFFIQPTLGGSEDLRGFREFRFRDRNVMVMNLEYRWEAFSGLDLALFGDAGKVFRSSREFNFENLETSYGFGFRFNTAKSVFWRIDTAFSGEGPRVFLKFGHVF